MLGDVPSQLGKRLLPLEVHFLSSLRWNRMIFLCLVTFCTSNATHDIVAQWEVSNLRKIGQGGSKSR